MTGQPIRWQRPTLESNTDPLPAVEVEQARAWRSSDGLTSQLLIAGDPAILRTIYDRAWARALTAINSKLEDNDEWRAVSKQTGAEADAAARAIVQHVVTETTIMDNLDLPGPLLKTAQDIFIAHLTGLGPLDPLTQDPTVTEIMINGPREVYVEQGGISRRATGCSFANDEHLAGVAAAILKPLNRKNDRRDPLTDARLPDGSRVNITDGSLSPSGTSITIRKFPDRVITLVDLVEFGALTQEHALEIANLVAKRASILVAGGTGSGKTTLLNALSGVIPTHERILTIEDSLELQLNPNGHVKAFESRPPDAAGENAVTIRQLVKNALRMRPERIIVGEVRDAVALDMLQAMNTGHEGSMSTVHANGALETIDRLGVLVSSGGDIDNSKIDKVIASALDLIITVDRYEDGSRRISGLYEVPSTQEFVDSGEPHLRPHPIWEFRIDAFDAAGKISGHVEQVGEISEPLRRRLTLDRAIPYKTWDDLVRVCTEQAEAPQRAKGGRA